MKVEIDECESEENESPGNALSALAILFSKLNMFSNISKIYVSDNLQFNFSFSKLKTLVNNLCFSRNF